MPIEFTEEQCEQIFQAAKYVASDLSWKPGEAPDVFVFQAKVLTKDGQFALDLSGHWQKNGRHNRTVWGFNLSYFGHCIRSYDMARKHRNPGGGRVEGPHKHRFSSSLIPRWAYKPSPPISEENPNQALIDFLLEANIDIPENYQLFMFP